MAPYVDSTEQLVVEVHVREMRRAVTFYTALGFQMVDDRGAFVILAWEEHRFFLAEHRHLPPATSFPQANMRIMVPNVDEYWQRAQDLKARVLLPIDDRDYGLRDFMISDPDGFGLRFASRL